MATESNKQPILYTVILALLLGGSAPWWWDKIFGSKTTAPTGEVSQNLLPIAETGGPIVITLPTNTATLDGRRSHDLDGSIKSYQWKKVSGPNAYSIASPANSTTEVTQLVEGTYEFELMIADDKNANHSAIQQVVVKGAGTPPPPPPTDQLIEKTYPLRALGVWGQSSRGDNEMDTDAGESVPVTCRTELYYTSSMVGLKVKFYTKEAGGDNTTFSGDKDYTLFTASPGMTVTGVNVRGNNYVANFRAQSRGSNHNLNLFPNSGVSYWDHLSYRIDGHGEDDNTRVGVQGMMHYTVKLRPN
jgi:hypothetical protein